jgi:predicted transcriptional regulator
VINDSADLKQTLGIYRKDIIEHIYEEMQKKCRVKNFPIKIDSSDLALIRYITKEINSGYFPEVEDYYSFLRKECDELGVSVGAIMKDKKQHSIIDAKHRRIKRRKIKEVAENLIKNNDGKYLYVLEFADNTAIGSEVEHGNVFHGISHLIISHH